MRSRALLLVLVLGLILASVPRDVRGETVDKSIAFELGKWYDLDAKDGPITLHRIRVVEQTGAFTKSQIFRPTDSEYLKTVQLQIEYSNTSSKEWSCRIDLVWVDGDGKTIDGYRGKEDLDKREDHDMVTVTLSTLGYGLEVAKKLKFKLDFNP